MLHELELRRAQALPHQGGVDTQRLHKGVLGALEGLLQRRFSDGAGLVAAHLEAEGRAALVKEQRAGAMGQILNHVPELAAGFDRVAVDGAAQDLFDGGQAALLLAGTGDLGERTEDLLGYRRAGDQTVDPADGHHMVRFKPEPQCARLKVRTGGEDLL